MADAPLPAFDYGDPIARWFVTEAWTIPDPGRLIAGIGERLVEAGIPLYRFGYFQRLPHPELAGRTYFWRRGTGVEMLPVPHSVLASGEYLDNPLPQVFAQRKAMRVRLEGTEPVRAPLLRQLQAEGATDYVAMPVFFSTGHLDALSVVADRPGGFSGSDLDRMYRLEFLFARIVEIHSLRDTATNFLDAYVGHAAGQRILAGEVRRGDGRTIDAVIWYSDLRGFTRASDNLPGEVIVELLNDYFGALADALVPRGGEILKFIGDAMLAIFPIEPGADRADAAARALAAVDGAALRMAALNRRRRAAGSPTLRFGVALHVGAVMFGNVGARARLDFTAIGPAVNHVARLEGLCSALEQPVVMSAALAALLPAARLEPLGEHALKDISEPQAVFGLRPV